MLSEIGLVAADTSRTRAYLAALERHSMLPEWTLLLLDDHSSSLTTDQPLESQQSSGGNGVQADGWSESEFDPLTPLMPWVRRLGINYELAGSRDINSPDVVRAVSQSSPSVLIYSGYGGQLLQEEILATGKQFLHVHGGFLPDFKGSTTQYYHLLEEGSLGASSLFLTAKIDSGPVISRRRFPAPSDRSEIDHRFDNAARARVLVETLKSHQHRGQWKFEVPDNRGGSVYYVIHPVLKHLAILGGKGRPKN